MSAADLPAFLHLLQPEHQRAASGAPFESYAILAVFGQMNQGEGIAVQRVGLESGQLRVVIGARPLAESLVQAATTYHLLQVARGELGDSAPSSWVLVDQTGRVQATAGVPSGGLIFQTLGRAEPVASQPASARIFLAASEADFSAFERFLSAEDRAALDKVDLSSQVVVAAFRGAIGMGGFGIEIQRVSLESGQLRVEALLQNPPPSAYGIAAFTSPYHVVLIRRAALGPAMPSSAVLVNAQGQVLALQP